MKLPTLIFRTLSVLSWCCSVVLGCTYSIPAVKVLATQLTWLSFILVRLAGQNTLTALSQITLCATLLLHSSNTLNILGFYLGRSAHYLYIFLNYLFQACAPNSKGWRSEVKDQPLCSLHEEASRQDVAIGRNHL